MTPAFSTQVPTPNSDHYNDSQFLLMGAVMKEQVQNYINRSSRGCELMLEIQKVPKIYTPVNFLE